MSRKVQLDGRQYNQRWRHLVNAYRVEAGSVIYVYLYLVPVDVFVHSFSVFT